MTIDALVKKVEWVLMGEVDGGECPACGHPTVVIEEAGYECENCGYAGDLPNAPGW